MASARPEIQFAMHQLACFSEDPKMSHEKAAKRVVRCSKGTLDEGIIVKPDRSEGLTCYVDATFSGNWMSEQVLDPRACLSRTGFFNLLRELPH